MATASRTRSSPRPAGDTLVPRPPILPGRPVEEAVARLRHATRRITQAITWARAVNEVWRTFNRHDARQEVADSHASPAAQVYERATLDAQIMMIARVFDAPGRGHILIQNRMSFPVCRELLALPDVMGLLLEQSEEWNELGAENRNRVTARYQAFLAGLVALEIATVTSLPAAIANSDSAGGAAMRLRIAQQITHVTLHHTGDTKPLMRGEDPAQRLRNLQAWGARDRNWWDVPYHFLLDLDGRVFEGRDWHMQGETNTTYDPGGHFLISMIGNYDVQEPSAGQLGAIADLMAWALKTNNLPIDRIGGHSNYADTGCPGKYLRRYLEDGTLRRMVQQRLNAASN